MVIVSPTPSLKVPALDPASEPLIRICETSPPLTTMVLGVWRILEIPFKQSGLLGKILLDRPRRPRDKIQDATLASDQLGSPYGILG
jgi:hypothetical protein